MKQISANYGAIKDTVYNFSAKELIAEGDKKNTILNEFVKLIKENPILKVQYLIYKSLENGTSKNERLAERLINENLKLIENFKWEDILRTNKEAKLKLLGQYDAQAFEDKAKIYESIHFLIKSVTQSNFTDIDNSQIAFDYIMEHLLKDKTAKPGVPAEEHEHPKFLSWKFITEHAVNKFNERYSHLNADEKDLVKVLLSPEENKRNYYENLKKENLDSIEDLLKSNIDEATKVVVNKFKDKILSLKDDINRENMSEAIISLFELKENFVELNNSQNN